jgi:hypothetical protein
MRHPTPRLLARTSFFAALLLIASPCSFGQINVLTYHNDLARTGRNLNETVLTPLNVKSSTFGKLVNVPVDGKVDAQPLVVSSLAIPGKGTRNVVFVVTEHDSVYALDATAGSLLWKVTLLKAGETPSDARNSDQVTPEIGITSTPVIDLTAGPHGTLYAVAMSKNAAGAYFHRLHAIDITTGAEQFGGPVTITGTYPGTGDGHVGGGMVSFDPKQYKARAGLLLSKGIVYVSFSSHGDHRPYNGWVMGYDRLTLAPRGIFNFAPNGSGASIWSGGGGPSADAAGNLYFSVANGTFDTTLDSKGFPSRDDYGNAFVKLLPSAGVLSPVDYWTMFNTVAESAIDDDLGSGGIMLLPDLKDASGKTRHLATGAGKDQNVYLVDRDNMGKFNASNNSNIYQVLNTALGGGEFQMPAWFNGHVYYGAINDVIRAFPVTSARLAPSPSSTSPTALSYPGAAPSISANGTSNALLWAVESKNPAILHAYDANNLGNELYTSKQAGNRDNFGDANKFITPTVANGKVYVGTPNSLAIFGLFNSGHGPLEFQTESLPFTTTGATLADYNWSGFPDGVGTRLASTAIGNAVTFTVNIPAAGTYDLRMDFRGLSSRGIFQLAVDGKNVGPATDEVGSSGVLTEVDLGTVTVATGNHAFKFTVVGKRASSTGYTLTFDYLKLTPP